MVDVTMFVIAFGGDDPGPAGYYVLLHSGGKEKELSCRKTVSTRRRMEAEAVIEAFLSLKTECNVTVVTESRFLCTYVGNYYNASKIKGLKYRALISDCIDAMSKCGRNIKFSFGGNDREYQHYVQKCAEAYGLVG